MLKSIAIAAVMLSGLLPVALPAQAARTKDSYRALHSAGIGISKQDNCDPYGRGWTAYYQPTQNHICISTLIYRYPKTLLQVIAHESTHAAQDCKAGLANNRFAPLGVNTSGLTAQEEQYVANERGQDLVIEREAYQLAHSPRKALTALMHFCNRRRGSVLATNYQPNNEL